MARAKLRSPFVVAVFTAAGILLAGGIAYAAISPIDNTGVIHACYNPTTGALKLQTVANCPTRGMNTPLSWNAQGIQGAPGADGSAGAQGAQGADGSPGVVTNAVFLRNPARSELFGNGAWQPLASAAKTVDLPIAATIDIRFSASSACLGAGNVKYVSIVLDGQRLVSVPLAPLPTATAAQTELPVALETSRAASAGTHSIGIETMISTGSSCVFSADHWHLAIETVNT